jgi:hypothetical protein
MANTYVVLDPPVFSEFPGQKGFKRVRVTLSNPYTVGGDAITAANCGLSTIDTLQVTVSPRTASLVSLVSWDRVNGKLQTYKSNTASEMTENGAVDLSAETCELLVYGKLA